MEVRDTQSIKVDLRKLYTKTEYAKAFNLSRPTIDRMIVEGRLKVATIKGTTLVIAD